MAWRKFQLGEGDAGKFWHIQVQKSCVTVHYGRVGTKGQKRDKQFDDRAAAQKEAERRIREKLDKGYLEAPSGGQSSKPSGSVASSLREMWAKLESRSDLFDCSSQLAKPASPAALKKAERRIGRALPDALRDLYRSLGDGARFYWKHQPSAAEVFRVEELDDSRGGSFELLPLAELRRIEDTEAWLFSNDGSGDGFAIDYSSGSPEIAWHTHDDEPITDHAGDFEPWFRDFVGGGFTDEDDPLHGVVKRWLAGKRKLAKVKPAVAPKRPQAGVETASFVRFAKLKGPARAIAILPDSRVAIGCDSGGVRLFDLRNGKALGSHRTSLVFSLRVSPSGSHLAAACMKALHLWDVDTWTLRQAEGQANDALFLPGGSLLSVCSSFVRRWSSELERGEEKIVDESVSGMGLSSTGKLVFYGHADDDQPMLALREPSSLELIERAPLTGIASIERSAVAVAGDVLVAGRGNGSVGKWQGAECIQEPVGGDGGKYVQYTTQWPLAPVCYDSEADLLYAGYTGLQDDGARYPAFRCIEASSGSAVWDHRLEAPLWALALTEDAKRIVATTADGRAFAADVQHIAQHGLAPASPE